MANPRPAFQDAGHDEPERPLPGQYAALRAYFAEGLPSAEVGQRSGYSPGSFRVLCRYCRAAVDRGDRFFRERCHGPQSAPRRDRVRELVVAMRERSLSVYDIQRELRLLVMS